MIKCTFIREQTVVHPPWAGGGTIISLIKIHKLDSGTLVKDNDKGKLEIISQEEFLELKEV